MQTFEEYLETMAAYQFCPSNRTGWQTWQVFHHGHYMAWHVVQGRRFLCRVFDEAALANIYWPALGSAANKYLLDNPEWSLLSVSAGLVYLAKFNDEGENA